MTGWKLRHTLPCLAALPALLLLQGEQQGREELGLLLLLSETCPLPFSL